jgi:hypothetical protein
MTTDADQFRELLAFIHADKGQEVDEAPPQEDGGSEDDVDEQEPDEF